MKRIILLLSLFVSINFVSKGADPGWTVNPASFAFSMTVTAVLNINGEESSDGSDKVAAFVGGDVRGVGNPSVFVPSTGQTLVFMTIYSNSADGETVTFKMYDASTDTQIDAVNSITFSSNASFGSNNDPYVILDNNVPTALSLSSTSVDEKQAANNTVGTFTTTDADAGDSHTYSLVSGNGDTDNSSFTINGSTLETAEEFNYEVKNSYNIRVQTSDSKATFEQEFTITINDLNDTPTAISLSQTSINENTDAGTVVGTFSTTDEDTADSHSYSFVAGTNDNSDFSISGNELSIVLSFDFETKDSYTIEVQTDDGNGGTFDQQFTITVNDINDAPTALSISASSIAENSATDSSIGTLTTTDQDTGDSHTYTFVDDANQGVHDNDDFVIVDNELKTKSELDYETKQFYYVFIETNDGNGGTFIEQFTISITDANDLPTALSLNVTTITENQSSGTKVGNLVTTDEDTGDSFTYTLVAGVGDDDNGSFQIGNTNELQSTAAFDFETKSSYSVLVQTDDGNGGTLSQQFTITIENANDAPTSLSLSPSQITENQDIGSTVGEFTTIDVDETDTHTYSLVSGAGDDDNTSFLIANGNQLQTVVTLDYETKNSYAIRVQTDDGNGGTFEEQITVSLIDANDAPTAITPSSTNVAENASVGTTVGTLSTTDADSGDSHSYTLVNGSGEDNSEFVIEGNELKTANIFDFESKAFYTINIQTDDANGGLFTQTFTITITDANDAPNAISLSENEVAENQSIGTAIGMFTTTDPDGADSHSYSLVSGIGGDDNASFQIANTNELQTSAIFDFESKDSYSILIRTSDGNGGTFDQQFDISITNANDDPTAISLPIAQIDEDQPIGSTVGTFNSTDVDTGDTHTYTLISGAGDDDNASFLIFNDELRTRIALDYETKDSYSILVKSDDSNGGTISQQFTITINDANDVPSQVALTPANIDENQSVGTSIGTLTTTDQDASNTYTYSLVDGTGKDNDFFVIDGDILRSGFNFNFEEKAFYYINVQTDDNQGGVHTQLITVSINNINDAPTALALSVNEIDENKPANTRVGILSTTDPDVADGHTYSLSSGVGDDDNASFTISGNELQTSASFDFETKDTYQVRVQTNDGNGGTFDQQFTITVNDANDAPIGLALSNASISENKELGTLVGTLIETDVDDTDSHTYALISGAGDTDNGSFNIIEGKLYSSSVFDYESKDSYSILAQVTDSEGASFSQNFTITIINANDVPTAIALSPANVNENESVNTEVGTLTSTDEDTGDSFSYTLVDGSGQDNASFVIVGDKLKTAAVFDFETKAFYYINVQTDDGNGGKFTQLITVSVNNSNDAPTGMSISVSEINENEPAVTRVGIFTTSDPDASDNHIYSLISGIGDDDNGSFVISGNELLSGGIFDFETKKSYKILVQTDDGNGGTFDKAYTITINDANDAPTALSIDVDYLNENMPVATTVGNLSVTDEDASDTHTYTLVAGTGGDDNASFIILNGVLQTNASFNYEIKNSYSILTRVTDIGGATFDQQFTITIKDANDAPSDLVLTVPEIAENSAVNSEVGVFTSTDEDAGDSFTYSLVDGSGGDNSSFIIVGDRLRISEIADFESKSIYYVNVKSTDSQGGSYTKLVSITILDANDAPTNLSVTNTIVSENLDAGTEFGIFTTVDQDATDSHTYSLVSGIGDDHNDKFDISGNILKTKESYNFELQNSFSILVETNDGNGGTLNQQFTVTITDANDVPTMISLSESSINENMPFSSKVADLSTEDEDENDSHLYSLVAGTGADDNDQFTIKNGELITNTHVLDFESQDIYYIRIQTNDKNGGVYEQEISIDINDLNEAPTIDNVDTENNVVLDIDENSLKGTSAGFVEASDVDAGQSLSYIFLQEGFIDQKLTPFVIDLNTGEITVNNPDSLNFEANPKITNPQYMYKVLVQDDGLGNLSDTATVVIQLNDLIEETTGLPVNNYMSPNGDGINDYFFIQNVDMYSDYELMIFNGAGEVVYTTSNYQNDWSGTYNGNALPTGVYVYSFKNATGTIIFKGSISIVN